MVCEPRNKKRPLSPSVKIEPQQQQLQHPQQQQLQHQQQQQQHEEQEERQQQQKKICSDLTAQISASCQKIQNPRNLNLILQLADTLND